MIMIMCSFTFWHISVIGDSDGLLSILTAHLQPSASHNPFRFSIMNFYSKTA